MASKTNQMMLDFLQGREPPADESEEDKDLRRRIEEDIIRAAANGDRVDFTFDVDDLPDYEDGYSPCRPPPGVKPIQREKNDKEKKK